MSSTTLPTIAENKTERKVDDPTGPGRVTISRELTTKLIPKLIGKNCINVYNFMNQSLAIQKNKIIFANTIGIINFDFYDKKTNEPLFCVIKQQHLNSKKLHKWYMIEKLFTKHQLQKEFNITTDQLPKSIRSNNNFKKQLQNITNISLCKHMKNIIQNTNWNKIPVYKRVNNREILKLFLTKSEFKNKLHKYNNQNIPTPLLPILRINPNNNQYWIQHIWITKIRDNISIGISLQMNVISSKLEVRGIYVDKIYISNMHQLATPHNCMCLDNFICNINDLAIGNVHDDKNKIKNLKRENNKLKHLLNGIKDSKDINCNTDNAIEMEQIGTKSIHIQNRYRSDGAETFSLYPMNNLSSIVSYPLIINTSPYYSTQYNVNSVMSMYSNNNIHSTSIGQIIPTVICPPTQYQQIAFENTNNKNEINIFNPKNDNNIFISKVFTEKWLPQIRETFIDCKMFYYYLYNSVKLQIIDKFGKIYCDKLAIMNLDIYHKMSGNILYGIIKPTNIKKFNWEMILLCDKMQIFKEYNIIESDLPLSSRGTQHFNNQINHKLQLQKCDIYNVKIQSLNIIKNKSMKSLQSIKSNVEITNDELKTYLTKSITNKIEWIPIVKIKNNNYWIEYVIIVEIPRCNVMHIGVSFNCINDRNLATSIFLDKKDIYNQHILTGLWMDCNHLNNFNSAINELICVKTKHMQSK